MKTLKLWLRRQIDLQYQSLLDDCNSDDLDTPFSACLCLGASLAKAALTEDA